MGSTSTALAAVLALLGAIWIGQGIGLIGGSFMTGDPFWAAVGLGLVGIAAVLVLRGRRRA